MIWEDHILHAAAAKLERELAEDSVPYCTTENCGYRGQPLQDGVSCPQCGSILIVGDVYTDRELEDRIDQELASVKDK
jgi:hypothetical protein